MPLPTGATFNELDGEEAKHVLVERFKARLSEVPYLQRHITLPRVRMTLSVTLELYADQPTPERHEIEDQYNLIVLNDTVDASPSRGGKPPDQIRDEHGISPPVPTRVHGLPFTEDVRPAPPVAHLEGAVVQDTYGLEVDRTGAGGMTEAGMAKMRNATVATLDQGPAGLARGGQRAPLGIFKNGGR